MNTPQINAIGLRAPNNRYQRQVVGWWCSQLLIQTVISVVVLVVLGLLIRAAQFWLLALAAALGLSGLITAVVMPLWWHRVHRWEVTETAVYTRTGYFWQNWRIAPMSRIQTVDTTRGPVQRLFGLSTVKVTTASSAGAVAISGLDDAQAQQLAHELALITDTTPGDAT